MLKKKCVVYMTPWMLRQAGNNSSHYILRCGFVPLIVVKSLHIIKVWFDLTFCELMDTEYALIVGIKIRLQHLAIRPKLFMIV